MTLYSTPEDKVIVFVQGCNNVIIVRKIITIIITMIFLTIMPFIIICNVVCDYCGECDDYDNFDDFQCVIAGPGQGLHRHPIINYHYHYLLNYSRPKTRATMSSIINYNYHYLLDYSRPKTRATAPVQKLRRGQRKTIRAISQGELVLILMMMRIYI